MPHAWQPDKWLRLVAGPCRVWWVCCCCDHGGLASLPDMSAAPALTWADQHLLCSAERSAPCRLQH